MKKIPVELPDEHVGYLLTQTYLLKQRHLNTALKQIGITYTQFVILATTLELADEKGTITQQTIASERQLDKVMVSNVVKTLVEKRLIKRFRHPTDHRALAIKLTSKGVEIAIQAKGIVKQSDLVFFSCIESEELYRVLKKLMANNSKE